MEDFLSNKIIEISDPIRILNAILLLKTTPVSKKVNTGSVGNSLSIPHKLRDINIPTKKKRAVVFLREREVSNIGIRDMLSKVT